MDGKGSYSFLGMIEWIYKHKIEIIFAERNWDDKVPFFKKNINFLRFFVGAITLQYLVAKVFILHFAVIYQLFYLRLFDLRIF